MRWTEDQPNRWALRVAIGVGKLPLRLLTAGTYRGSIPGVDTGAKDLDDRATCTLSKFASDTKLLQEKAQRVL